MPAHDLNTRAILWTATAIALTVAAAVVAVLLLVRHWQISPGGERLPLDYDFTIPGATLQSAPQIDLAQYRAEKRKQLETSAWVDAKQGIVRIPIADAMSILAQHAASAPKEPRP